MKRIILIALLIYPVCSYAFSKKDADRALQITPESAKALVSVKDDYLDVKAEIDSINVFQVKEGLLKLLKSDSFIRVFIDKKTGKADFQIYQYVMYSGDWRFYQGATYEYIDGAKQADFIPISSKVISCSSSAYGTCTHIEQMAFKISETELRKIASLYIPNQAKAWQFKFSSKSGQDWKDGIMAAEVAGILLAVDEYRAKHNLPLTQ